MIGWNKGKHWACGTFWRKQSRREAWGALKSISGSSRPGTAEMNPTRNHEVAVSIPDLPQWVKDLALLWLWCRPAATAPIRPLSWEPPDAASVALKRQQDKQTTKKKNKGR